MTSEQTMQRYNTMKRNILTRTDSEAIDKTKIRLYTSWRTCERLWQTAVSGDDRLSSAHDFQLSPAGSPGSLPCFYHFCYFTVINSWHCLADIQNIITNVKPRQTAEKKKVHRRIVGRKWTIKSCSLHCRTDLSRREKRCVIRM